MLKVTKSKDFTVFENHPKSLNLEHGSRQKSTMENHFFFGIEIQMRHFGAF